MNEDVNTEAGRTGFASPVTDDAWESFNRQACGLHYIAHKMRAMEMALREVLASAHPTQDQHPAMFAAWQKAKGVLSLPTPPPSTDGGR